MACQSVTVTRSRPPAARGGGGVDRRVRSTQHSAAGLAAGGRGPELGKGRGCSWARAGVSGLVGSPAAAIHWLRGFFSWERNGATARPDKGVRCNIL